MSRAIKQARAMYQGDRGYARAMPGTGYARGDPGLFGSLFGGFKKALGLTSIIPGPGGLISRGLSAILGGKAQRRQQAAAARMATQAERRAAGAGHYAGLGPTAVEPVPGLRGLAQRLIPGGATGLQVPGEAIGARVPQGYHLNKSSYWRGAGGQNPEWIPRETIFVRNRKRNPLNPRAWDRAFGRLKSAQNFKKKMGRITIREVC